MPILAIKQSDTQTNVHSNASFVNVALLKLRLNVRFLGCLPINLTVQMDIPQRSIRYAYDWSLKSNDTEVLSCA